MAVLRKPLLSLVSLVFVVLICEATFRIAAERSNSISKPHPDPDLRFAPFVSDGLLGYRLRKDWVGVHSHSDYRVIVRTNRLGMRGRRVPTDDEAKKYRILVLGDSFAFGFGVEDDEAFPAVLDRTLSADGRTIEVLNAAVPGYSFDHYLLYLREKISTLRPDLVLIAACENDIDDLAWSALTLGSGLLPTQTQSRVRLIDRHGRLQYVNQSNLALPGWIERPPAWLQNRSYFFNWLRFRIARIWVRSAHSRVSREQSLVAGDAPKGEIGDLTPSEIDRGLRTGRDFRSRYHSFLFDAIIRLLEREMTPLRVVAIGPDRSGGVAQECLLSKRDCLDLSEVLGPEFFLPIDGHWNAGGHRIIARRILAWLVSDAELGLHKRRPTAPES